MPRSDIFPLADRLVPGGLAEYLTAARAEGQSHENITFRLRDEHDIKVSTETVRKWCRRTGADSSPTDTAGDAA